MLDYMRKYSMVVAVFATWRRSLNRGRSLLHAWLLGMLDLGGRDAEPHDSAAGICARARRRSVKPRAPTVVDVCVHIRRCLSKRRSIGVPSMVDDCPLSEMYVLTRRTPTYGAYRPGAHGPPTYVIHDPHPHLHKAFSAHHLARPSWDIRIITTHLPHRAHGQEP